MYLPVKRILEAIEYVKNGDEINVNTLTLAILGAAATKENIELEDAVSDFMYDTDILIEKVGVIAEMIEEKAEEKAGERTDTYIAEAYKDLQDTVKEQQDEINGLESDIYDLKKKIKGMKNDIKRNDKCKQNTTSS